MEYWSSAAVLVPKNEALVIAERQMPVRPVRRERDRFLRRLRGPVPRASGVGRAELIECVLARETRAQARAKPGSSATACS